MSDYCNPNKDVPRLARQLVTEYLQFMGYEDLRMEFEQESTNRVMPELRTNTSEINSRLLNLVKNGDRDKFFSLWGQHFSHLTTKNDRETKDKMRFYLEIFFATYNYRGTTDFDDDENSERMSNFKQFLETEGSDLSQSNDFFPYCALVCIKNPTTHRAFKNIFTEEWEKSLIGKLRKFISKFYGQKNPRLYDILMNVNSDHKVDDVVRQKKETEKKLDQAAKRLSSLESDYRNLIDIASELIDALEDTVNGKSLTPENLDEIAKRMFNNQTTRRIVSGRASLRPNRTEQPKKPATPPRPKDTIVFSKLNFEKVRQKIAERDEKETPPLLQALRWRLTRSDRSTRKEVLQSFISNDILGCSKLHQHGKTIIESLNLSSDIILDNLARLINSLASLARGRDYITLSPSLLESMISAMKKEPGDSPTRQQLVGAIQKLTLRRQFQTEMIKMNLIQWIMDQLADSESLSDYSLEYGVALLMNLCLLNSGRQVCVSHAQKYLSVLLRLLENPNSEIQPYIHGTLYTLLSDQRIRKAGNKIEMERRLNDVLEKSTTKDAAQISHIIRRLQDESELSPKSDEEEEADNSEDDPEVMEADLNENETVREALCGEELLGEKYSSPLKENGDFYMARPATPLRVRKSKETLQPSPMGLGDKLTIKNYDDVFAARPRLSRTPDESGRRSN